MVIFSKTPLVLLSGAILHYIIFVANIIISFAGDANLVEKIKFYLYNVTFRA